MYKTDHVELPVEKIKLHDHTRRDRSSNIVLGYDKDKSKSEAAESFKKFPGTHKSDLDAHLRDDLRKSHFAFRDDTPYETISKSAHKDLLAESRKVNTQGVFKSLAKDLRKNHFEYGTHALNYDTTSRDLKGRQGNPADLKKELANDLRRNHFTIGANNILAKDTTYRDATKSAMDYLKDNKINA